MSEFLFVAHPGHELLIYDRFGKADVRVTVLTDGSGSDGASRAGLSRDLVTRLGGSVVEPFGRFTDARFYQAILDADVAFFAALIDGLVDALDDPAIDTLISDAAEHYNPVHDLCYVIAALAVRRLAQRGRQVSHLVCPIAADPLAGDRLVEALSRSVAMEKRQVADDFAPLISDLESLVETRPQLVDCQILVVPPSDAPLLPEPVGAVFYETYGRERLARRGGGELITYADHMAPLVTALERAR